MAQWFYRKNGQKLGPVDTATLKRMAIDGKLAPSDMIWREGLGQWVAASQAKGLFPTPVPAMERGSRAVTAAPIASPVQSLRQHEYAPEEPAVELSQLKAAPPTSHVTSTTRPHVRRGTNPAVWASVGAGAVALIATAIIVPLAMRSRVGNPDKPTAQTSQPMPSAASSAQTSTPLSATPVETTQGPEEEADRKRNNEQSQFKADLQTADAVISELVKIESAWEVGLSFADFRQKVQDLNFQWRKLEKELDDSQVHRVPFNHLQAAVESYKKALGWWDIEIKHDYDHIKLRAGVFRESAVQSALKHAKQANEWPAADFSSEEATDGSVLRKIETFKAPPYPKSEYSEMETYDEWVRDGRSVPPTLTDTLVVDLCIPGGVLNNANTTVDDMTTAIAFYRSLNWNQLPGLRPWTHRAFINSLSEKEQLQLANDLVAYIHKNGVRGE